MRRALLPQMLAGVTAAVPCTIYRDFTELGDIPTADIGFVVPPYMGPPAELVMLGHFPNLEVCQILTAGYEHARPYIPQGVILCNAAGVHDTSTAELAIGLIIASQRGIDDFARGMAEGHWLHAPRVSLADRRVVIIGAGGLGTAIRRRLETFEVDVRTVGRTARADVWPTAALPELLPWAEIVILAVPLTEHTRHLVDTEFLSQMADGALLVNMARGPVVDTEALTTQVAAGRIRAALDVTDPEPLPPDHPLWRLPNVLISPHVGGNTSAFLPRAQQLVAAQLERWAAGAPLRNVISE